MSFGSGGFGGFGSTNTNNQPSFGAGFGANNNNNNSSGKYSFGSTTNTGASMFGQSNNNNTGGMFGGGANTSATFGGGGGGTSNLCASMSRHRSRLSPSRSGFYARDSFLWCASDKTHSSRSMSGFGNNTNTSFGSKPFGASTGGGLFGNNTSSGSTFGGGFGASANNTTPAFGGGGNTGGGLFGQNKPGFGASTSGAATGTSLFGGGGGGSNTGGGFGSTNTTGGFGASTGGGFGANNSTPPNNGTANTAWTLHSEKEPGANSSTQQYQTITFVPPYEKYSLEELRLVDYNQGRRYGNQNGQGGAFGQSSGFGGFGANANPASGFGANTSNNNTTSGGLFGGNTANTGSTFGSGTGAFGNTQNASGGGGLFGQNKTGGMFGATPASQPSGGGGLFGNTASNTGGFGSGGSGFGASAAGGGGGGGGLFGQTNQNQTQSKPFGGFGSSAPAPTPFGGAGTSGGFGTAANQSGGLFGQQNQAPNQQTTNTGGGLFGNTGSSFGQTQQTQPQPSTGLFGGGFGQNNQQNQQNQPKTGGLFGSSTATTGGLFGQNNQQPQQSSGAGLFGNTASQNTGSSLFGQKPAATGSSLFGNTATNTGGSTGGLFGASGTQNNPQNTGSSLFGQQNQQKSAGVFGGATANTNTGGGIFGSLGQSNNNNNSNLGNSLFSSQQQQQPQQPSMNNSLFGASGSSLLQTSMNTNPYGNDSLFTGIVTPTQSPGPLATPLSSSQKHKKAAILPQHKLNPSASTRLLTPQGRRTGGYGFTYSTYGTPNSASSQTSPGFSGSYNGSLTRSLGKSLSVSNLRNSYTPETSILAPGAFSTNGRTFGSGSLKKLNINRAINGRTPLFEDLPDKNREKRVSFAGADVDTSSMNGSSSNGGALVLHAESSETSPGDSPATVNGDSVKGTAGRPEMTQAHGGELTPVPEIEIDVPLRRRRTTASLNLQNGKAIDPTPGAYWCTPILEQLRKLSKRELENVPNFEVGRDLIGKIQFNQGKPVDLSGVDLDKLLGDIVRLDHRNASVYGDTCSAQKPPRGTGLNQPSRIILGNSWPRNKAGKKDQKHLERLKRVSGTQFEKYLATTGEWIFTVPHFSSYGLNDDDYSDDEAEEDDEDDSSSEGSSGLSPPPDTPAQLGSNQTSGTPQDGSFASPTQSSPDDTFDFKKGMPKRASVPGGYGDEVGYEEEDDEMEDTRGESFLGERSVGPLDGQRDADHIEDSGSGSAQDQNIAGSVSGPVRTTEQTAAKASDPFKNSLKPKSILKASQSMRPNFGTPSKGHLVFNDDWASQLQRTISPKKQDRQALRESQGDVLQARDGNTTNFAQSTSGRPIASAMDLMDSLFGETEKPKLGMSKRTGRGIEVSIKYDALELDVTYLPYPKRPKTSRDLNELSEADQDFHNCSKPRFSETGTLTFASKGSVALEIGLYRSALPPIVGAHKDIRFAKLPTFDDATPATLTVQKEWSEVSSGDGVPSVRLIIRQSDPTNPTDDPESHRLSFAKMADAVDISTAAGVHEQQAWRLLSVLFDDRHQAPSDMTQGSFQQNKERYRKEQLSNFWMELVSSAAERDAENARNAEEKAIAYLSRNDVVEACYALTKGLDFKLATLVAQIGGDDTMRDDMANQIDEWRSKDMLSEIEDSIPTTFNISRRFGLDWRRAFGLRLWYGTMTEEPIEMAVAQFADALRDGKEDVKPIPWFNEQDVDMGWKDPEPEQREDLLWGILKLYASSKLEIPANVEEVLAPENVSGHPLNARLSFQLFQIFRSRHEDPREREARQVGLPTVRYSDDLHSSFLSTTETSTEKDDQSESPLDELGDRITLTYGASLHTPDYWKTAIWVYAHLSSPHMREHYIRSVLAQFLTMDSVVETDPTYEYLTGDLKISTKWLHTAAALQAKTKGDSIGQAMHLIKAKELGEAHEVLCRTVGPDSVISRDYDNLRELMGGFDPAPPNWSHGGQIYFDYIELLDLTAKRASYRDNEERDQQIHDLLCKLQRALEVVAKNRWDQCELEERVALTEIAGTVADLVAKSKRAERARVLKLPLTEDLWLKHSIDLSTSYYRKVMAAK
ncbi:nuclear protein 96-domain-containing protein [Massariosphaeria phaeospora]|uniref:Nuclear protein 96-domain-containing protein n=1 Tax=Massariosphaeria phaeospora TaxID=100035 RepID=A0A7C8M6B2_9PLEO|nr:nuclear protein 96-domain-containing protein [Massariosphaeria phaeospora]